jgi:hypothetical protein
VIVDRRFRIVGKQVMSDGYDVRKIRELVRRMEKCRRNYRDSEMNGSIRP